jgi:hypothetical protein
VSAFTGTLGAWLAGADSWLKAARLEIESYEGPSRPFEPPRLGSVRDVEARR